MNKLIVVLSLLAPLAVHAQGAQKSATLSAAAERAAAAKALGPGLTGAGYSVTLVGRAKAGERSFIGFPRQNPHPVPGGIGPALPPLSGLINVHNGDVTHITIK